MKKENTINAAIQLLPVSERKDAYRVIDEAIQIIKQSGLKYKVCPFETVVEGEYSKITEIIEQIRDKSFEAGANEIIINLKLQFGATKDILIHDKMRKYE